MKAGDAIKYHTSDGDHDGRILSVTEDKKSGKGDATIAYDDKGSWVVVSCEQGTDPGKFELV